MLVALLVNVRSETPPSPTPAEDIQHAAEAAGLRQETQTLTMAIDEARASSAMLLSYEAVEVIEDETRVSEPMRGGMTDSVSVQ